jgi:hypothetical protein
MDDLSRQFESLTTKNCITGDDIQRALNIFPEYLKTEHNVKWVIQIFGWEQLCRDINALDGRVDELCKGKTVVKRKHRKQYYDRLLGPLSKDEFKDLLAMVYNESVTHDDMLDSYEGKIFSSRGNYSFFGLMCLCIKIVKIHSNQDEARTILHSLLDSKDPSIFSSYKPKGAESSRTPFKVALSTNMTVAKSSGVTAALSSKALQAALLNTAVVAELSSRVLPQASHKSKGAFTAAAAVAASSRADPSSRVAVASSNKPKGVAASSRTEPSSRLAAPSSSNKIFAASSNKTKGALKAAEAARIFVPSRNRMFEKIKIKSYSVPPPDQQGGSRRRRTAHRKRKSHRKSKRVHHTHKKHTRRHRHSRRR